MDYDPTKDQPFHKTLPGLIDSFNPMAGPRKISKIMLAHFIRKTACPANHDAIIEAWRRLDPEDEYGVIAVLEAKKAAIEEKALIEKLAQRTCDLDWMDDTTSRAVIETGHLYLFELLEMAEEQFARFGDNASIVKAALASQGLSMGQVFETELRDKIITAANKNRSLLFRTRQCSFFNPGFTGQNKN